MAEIPLKTNDFCAKNGEVNGNSASIVDAEKTEIFDNLVWMTSAEAASYLRKSVGAIRVMVCRGQIRARKFHRRLYFKKIELDRVLDSAEMKGGSDVSF